MEDFDEKMDRKMKEMEERMAQQMENSVAEATVRHYFAFWIVV